MNEPEKQRTGLSRRQWLILAACALGLIAALSGIYSINPDQGNAPQRAEAPATEDKGLSKALATGSMATFVFNKEPKELPSLEFRDGTGEARALSDWRGRVVLLNLWATWCAPCREEMPDLAELESKLGGKDFEVVAVSVDRKGAEASAQFLTDHDATALKLYVDRSATIIDQVKALGLPTTLLIDRTGKSIGRLTGPADWASPEAIKLIEAALADGK